MLACLLLLFRHSDPSLKTIKSGRKKAIVTKKTPKEGVELCTNPNAPFRNSSHTMAKGGKDHDMYQTPGGVKKISNSIVSGRSVGAMSYDPQVSLLCCHGCCVCSLLHRALLVLRSILGAAS